MTASGARAARAGPAPAGPGRGGVAGRVAAGWVPPRACGASSWLADRALLAAAASCAPRASASTDELLRLLLGWLALGRRAARLLLLALAALLGGGREVHAVLVGSRRAVGMSEHAASPDADVVIPEPARLGALRLAWLRLRSRGRLRVGAGVRVGRGADVRIARGARVELGDGCYLGRAAGSRRSTGTLRVGPRALVGARAFVIGHSDLTLGAGCVIGDFAAVGVLGAPGASGRCRSATARGSPPTRRSRPGRACRPGVSSVHTKGWTSLRNLDFRARRSGESRTHARLRPPRLHARRRR